MAANEGELSSDRLARALIGMQEILGRDVPTPNSIPLMCRELVKLLGCDRSAVLLLEDDHYSWAHSWGSAADVVERLSQIRISRTDVIPQRFEMDVSPLIINDALEDPNVGWVARMAGVNGLVLVPLVGAGGAPIGILSAAYCENVGSFSEFQALVLVGAAGLIHTAIIRERIAQDHLRLTVEAADAEDRERRRLGLELHDSALQDAYALCLRLEALELKIDDQLLSDELADAVVASRLVAKRLRLLTNEMHPETQASAGLQSVLLEQLTRAGQDENCKFTFEDVTTVKPTAEVSIVLSRIASQALINVRSHAQATEVTVCLRTTDAGTTLTISDNGCGFDTEGVYAGHLGLVSMHERAESGGGSLAISSTVGAGTTVEAWLPHAGSESVGVVSVDVDFAISDKPSELDSAGVGGFDCEG